MQIISAMRQAAQFLAESRLMSIPTSWKRVAACTAAVLAIAGTGDIAMGRIVSAGESHSDTPAVSTTGEGKSWRCVNEEGEHQESAWKSMFQKWAGSMIGLRGYVLSSEYPGIFELYLTMHTDDGRADSLKIASSQFMEVMLEEAASQGYEGVCVEIVDDKMSYKVTGNLQR